MITIKLKYIRIYTLKQILFTFYFIFEYDQTIYSYLDKPRELSQRPISHKPKIHRDIYKIILKIKCLLGEWRISSQILQ